MYHDNKRMITWSVLSNQRFPELFVDPLPCNMLEAIRLALRSFGTLSRHMTKIDSSIAFKEVMLSGSTETCK